MTDIVAMKIVVFVTLVATLIASYVTAKRTWDEYKDLILSLACAFLAGVMCSGFVFAIGMAILFLVTA